MGWTEFRGYHDFTSVCEKKKTTSCFAVLKQCEEKWNGCTLNRFSVNCVSWNKRGQHLNLSICRSGPLAVLCFWSARSYICNAAGSMEGVMSSSANITTSSLRLQIFKLPVANWIAARVTIFRVSIKELYKLSKWCCHVLPCLFFHSKTVNISFSSRCTEVMFSLTYDWFV